MLTAYKIENDYLDLISPSTDSNRLKDAVWIDLVNPTTEETEIIKISTGISLPNVQETEELEASSHYEVYPTGFQINCLFLLKFEEAYSNINVAFLCNTKCLISLSACEIPAIRLLQKQWQKAPRLKGDPVSIICALHEIKIDKVADLIEGAYLSIDKISHQIFERVNNDLKDMPIRLTQVDYL